MDQVGSLAGRRVANGPANPSTCQPAATRYLKQISPAARKLRTSRTTAIFFRETIPMIRTVFTIGLFAVLGLFALRLVFGILPWVFAMLIGLMWFAVKILIIGLIIYAVIRIFSPDTAKKMRSWGDSSDRI